MSSQLHGLILIGLGAISIVFARPLAKQAAEFQRRVFRVELSPGVLWWGYVFGGLLFCIIGALALLGFVEFRQ